MERCGHRKALREDDSRRQAAAVMQVRAALASKVSRERVGTELEGMMNGECLLPPQPQALHGLRPSMRPMNSCWQLWTGGHKAINRQHIVLNPTQALAYTI